MVRIITSENEAEELFSFVRTIRSSEMRSSAVFTVPALVDLLKNKGASIHIGNRAAIVVEPDTENILRLYFYAQDAEALCEVKKLLPETERDIVCDVLGKEDRAVPLVNELQQAGFRLYAKFQRMICQTPLKESTLDLSEVEVALENDADEILEITYEAFDPLTARILSRDALRKRIREKEVFVIRKDGKIAGFTSFDSNNKRVGLLDHVITRPEYRREKIARRILHYKWIHHNSSTYYILWINVLCKEPIRYHESNGFAADGMYDYILLYK